MPWVDGRWVREDKEGYTQEEMDALEEAGLDGDKTGLEEGGAVLSGAIAGGSAGYKAGSSAGPAGGVVGAMIGSAKGAAQGGAAYHEDQELLREAFFRDQELEAELDAVDHLDQYITTTNVANAGVRQQDQIAARQAAARGGLGEAAGQGLATDAAAKSDFAQSQRLAAAIPAAERADAIERQLIMDEEERRQALMDDALEGLGAGQEAIGESAAGFAELGARSEGLSTDSETETIDTLDDGGAAAKDTSGSSDTSYSTARTTGSSSGSSSSNVDGIERAERELMSDQDSGVLGENAYNYWDNDYGFAQAGIHADDNINAEGGFLDAPKGSPEDRWRVAIEEGDEEGVEEAKFDVAYTEMLLDDSEAAGERASAEWPDAAKAEMKKGWEETRDVISQGVSRGLWDSTTVDRIAQENPQAMFDPRDWSNAVAEDERKQLELYDEEYAREQDEASARLYDNTLHDDAFVNARMQEAIKADTTRRLVADPDIYNYGMPTNYNGLVR